MQNIDDNKFINNLVPVIFKDEVIHTSYLFFITFSTLTFFIGIMLLFIYMDRQTNTLLYISSTFLIVSLSIALFLFIKIKKYSPSTFIKTIETANTIKIN